MAKRTRIDPEDAPDGLHHNPFAALRPSGTPAPAPAPRPAEADPEPDSGADGPRLVVRREKRGRAGKTVTRVSGLGLRGAQLDELARRLKRALGCGASVEAPDVLLQGALTDRAAAWLTENLGARVTIGN